MQVVAIAARIEQRFDLGMVRSGRLSPPFTEDMAVAHDYTSDARVGRRLEQSIAREIERAAHEAVIEFRIHCVNCTVTQSRPRSKRSGVSALFASNETCNVIPTASEESQRFVRPRSPAYGSG